MRVGRGARLVVVGILLVAGVLVVAGVVMVAINPPPRDTTAWTLAASLPEGRGEVATAVVEGRLYVIGGLAGAPARTAHEVGIYDPGHDTWTDGPPLPEARHHAAAAGLGGSVFVSGGAGRLVDWVPLTNLWELAAGTDAWQELPQMPEGRYGHRMVALEGRLYVIGGRGGTGAVLVYDPAAAEWSSGAATPVVRDHLAVVVADGDIWAIGGRNGGLSADVEIYDPQTDRWREGPPLPAVTSGAAEAAGDGLVLISGGEDPAAGGQGVFDRHWWLDTGDVAGGWRELPRPPYAVHGAEGAFIDGRFYVPGGATRAGGLSFLAWSSALQVLDLDELR